MLTHAGELSRRLLTLAVTATALAPAALAGSFADSIESADAEAFGGCTYSWGSPCYIVYGVMNSTYTLDSEHAYYWWGPTYAENGYRGPTRDGRTRDVCGTIMYHEGRLEPYGWTCAWGAVDTSYPLTTGYSVIGTGQVYYGIALYQDVNYAEYGPCPRGWPSACH
jgi:hypothetical protein